MDSSSNLFLDCFSWLFGHIVKFSILLMVFMAISFAWDKLKDIWAAARQEDQPPDHDRQPNQAEE